MRTVAVIDARKGGLASLRAGAIPVRAVRAAVTAWRAESGLTLIRISRVLAQSIHAK